VRYYGPAQRVFHRERNYAILIRLIDTACRIGEAVSFKMDDYVAAERRITVRESKGRESRALPTLSNTILTDASSGRDNAGARC